MDKYGAAQYYCLSTPHPKNLKLLANLLSSHALSKHFIRKYFNWWFTITRLLFSISLVGSLSLPPSTPMRITKEDVGLAWSRRWTVASIESVPFDMCVRSSRVCSNNCTA